jgi:hypothetical protein
VTRRSYGTPLGDDYDYAAQRAELRDRFAMFAIRSAADAICDALDEGGEGEAYALTHAARHAKAAYILADAMLEARDK